MVGGGVTSSIYAFFFFFRILQHYDMGLCKTFHVYLRLYYLVLLTSLLKAIVREIV